MQGGRILKENKTSDESFDDDWLFLFCLTILYLISSFSLNKYNYTFFQKYFLDRIL